MATTKHECSQSETNTRNGSGSSGVNGVKQDALARDCDRIGALFARLSDEPDCLHLMFSLIDGAQDVVALSEQIRQDEGAVHHYLGSLQDAGLIEPTQQDHRTCYRLTDSGSLMADGVQKLAGLESDGSEPVSPIPPEMLKEVGQVTNDPEGWMRRSNSQFEGRRPVDLLGTPDEPRILRVIKAAQQGFFA